MIVVVAGIARRSGRIMLCQRRPVGHDPSKWEFPGGKVEPGEGPERALERELQEELGIPTVGIEKEYTLAGAGQLRTRIQAFVESLEIKHIQGGKL